MLHLELSFACGEDSLSVHRFRVHEAISALFTVSVIARSESHSVDLQAIVGQPASLRAASGVRSVVSGLGGGARLWAGIVSNIEQAQGVETTGSALEVSTYHLRIVPALWLLTQRRNYRIYQHLAIPDIVDRLLAEWSIEPVWKINRGQYPKLEYKVQYGETDNAFLCRLLEEAGIAFAFANDEAGGSALTLVDRPHAESPRAGGPLRFVDSPNQVTETEFVTRVRLAHEVRPGALALRDHDFRNPAYPLFGEAPRSPEPESRLEQYRYEPGAFLVETGKGGGTPVADDRGVARYDQAFGKARAERLLLGARAGKRLVSFETNAIDLLPGSICSFENHPHAELNEAATLLVSECAVEGDPTLEWRMSAQAVFTDVPYLPPQRTPKPRVEGVQSATVVGPAGQEIHVDELGRVRVQFPWDREGRLDDGSSSWIRASQGWAGTGYGMIVIPRVGQEVLVGFLDGDPDQPVIVGCVFNATQKVPYKLPDHRTRSTWKSDSSPGSNGFNEIMFEDLKGRELVYLQAQKNLRKLVKNDEAITVGHDRQKLVVRNETETTGANRTEVTGVNRTEITGVNRVTVVGGSHEKLVIGDEIERTDGGVAILVGEDQDIVIRQVKRERVEGDCHLRVQGKRNEQIDGKQSLTVGKDRHEKIAKSHALEAGQQIHLKAGTALVIEAAKDLTLKGPGGFIRIDAQGVTIQGDLVKINSGGSAGSGAGAQPEAPEEAKEAVVVAPVKPEPEDVAITGIAQ
ncbi:type VI secretion system Vgr family protein [Sorangium sp. So ce176]|uniref:type VI secretion system Vgr family protein n=1 Tax=Sorangium sp. So ce176 TaxID=3133286 RepID=UPI003F61591F